MAASLAASHETPVIAADHSLVERPAREVYGPEDYLAMTRKSTPAKQDFRVCRPNYNYVGGLSILCLSVAFSVACVWSKTRLSENCHKMTLQLRFVIIFFE